MGSVQAIITVNNVMWRRRVIESLTINLYEVDYMIFRFKLFAT